MRTHRVGCFMVHLMMYGRYLLEQDLRTRVPHTRWNDMATSSTTDIGTSEVSVSIMLQYNRK